MASIVRSTANRAIHLRITPRPSNLGESREILALISQFGEVEYFKNLKYDALPGPNASLVIFKSEDAALDCLKRSPIRFRMGRAPAGEERIQRKGRDIEHKTETVAPPFDDSAPTTRARGPLFTPFGVAPAQKRSMSTNTLPTPPRHADVHNPFQPPPMPLLESRVFEIQTNPARVHFRDQINVGRYHGSFLLDTGDIAQKDLLQTVPQPGLSCINWQAEGRPWRHMTKAKQREHEGPSRRRSLRELYNEGVKAAAKAPTKAEGSTLPG